MEAGPVKDLTRGEMAGIVPLTVLMVLLGVFPSLLLETMKRDVDALGSISNAARIRVEGKPTSIAPEAPQGPPPMPKAAPKQKKG